MTYTTYQSRLGRIEKTINTAETIYDAWDGNGEYLGGFTTQDRALEAIQEAKEVHEALLSRYNNRRYA
jgi:hypothetical protein